MTTRHFIKQKYPNTDLEQFWSTPEVIQVMESFLKEGLTKAAEQATVIATPRTGGSYIYRVNEDSILNVFKEMTGKEMPK